MKELDVAIKVLAPEAVMPGAHHSGDAGHDLRSRVDVEIAPGARIAIPTGIALAIPDGWAGFVLPRSGLARRHGIGLANAPGLIDSGYRGELEVLLINHDSDVRFKVERGDRIAQLVFVECGIANFVEVSVLPVSERGARGFGSSGK